MGSDGIQVRYHSFAHAQGCAVRASVRLGDAGILQRDFLLAERRDRLVADLRMSSATSGIGSRLFLADHLDQSLVLRLPVSTVVDLAMAARADSTHEPGIVRAAVAEASGMMGFEIGLALQGDERRWLIAALADPACTSEDIAADRC